MAWITEVAQHSYPQDTPLDGRWLAPSIELCGLYDFFFGNPGNMGDPVRRILLNPSLQFFKAWTHFSTKGLS